MGYSSGIFIYMKLQENIDRITEIMRVNEQIPDSRFAPKGYEPQKSDSNLSNLSFDDLVDVVSAAIDGVPGIGNLISLGIDLTHTIAYFVRFHLTNNDEEKIEYGTLGIVTLAGTFIPVGGNALPIIARQGVKQVLRHTPNEILLIGKKLGIYNQTVLFLKKSKWKYSLLLLLIKVLGDEAAESLTVVTKKLKEVWEKIKNYKSLTYASEALLFTIKFLQEMIVDLNAAIVLSKELK